MGKSIIERLQNPVRILSNGLLLGCILAVFSVSYAFLVYKDNLANYLALGISASLIGAFILALIVAIFSSTEVTIAGLQATFVVLAALVANSIAEHIQHYSPSINPIPTVIAAISLMSFLLGFFMYLFGIMGWGKLIRYIPYPVIGGFLAGTGWLIVISTFESLSGKHNADGVFHYILSSKEWMLPLAFGFAIALLKRFYTKINILPLMLIAGFSLFYLYLYLFNISLTEAKAVSLMVGPLPTESLPLLPTAELDNNVQWSLLTNYWPSYCAVVLLSVISMLLNISSFETLSKQSIAVRRELCTTGFANALVALVGGFSGYFYLSFTQMNYKLDTKSRAVGIIASFVCLALLLIGTAPLTYLPKFLFSGFLLYIGIDFMLEWLVDIKRKISWTDYGIVLIITAVVIMQGVLSGIVAGLLLSLVIFFVRYSRIPVINSMLPGTFIRSHVNRNERDNQVLERFGDSLLVVNVRGYLFFGNVDELTNNVLKAVQKNKPKSKAKKQEDMPKRYVILNFNQVTGIEISGSMAFVKLLYRAAQQNIQLLFTSLPSLIEQEINHLLGKEKGIPEYMIFKDLDHALEWVENQLLVTNSQTNSPESISLFHAEFPDIDNPELLLSYAKLLPFSKGDVVCREGELGEEMFWLAKGTLEIVQDDGHGGQRRLRKILAGTIVGEMAIYLHQKRSATVIAAEDCLTYRLDATALERLTQEKPQLAAAFHKGIVAIVAKRLQYANKLLNN